LEHSLGFEEEVVDRVEIDVAGGRSRSKKAGPLPETTGATPTSTTNSNSNLIY
jgi:hypothetical protein